MPGNFFPQVLTVLKLTIHKWAAAPELLRVAHISHVVPDTTCHFRDMRIKETNLFRRRLLLLLLHLLRIILALRSLLVLSLFQF